MLQSGKVPLLQISVSKILFEKRNAYFFFKLNNYDNVKNVKNSVKSYMYGLAPVQSDSWPGFKYSLHPPQIYRYIGTYVTIHHVVVTWNCVYTMVHFTSIYGTRFLRVFANCIAFASLCIEKRSLTYHSFLFQFQFIHYIRLKLFL